MVTPAPAIFSQVNVSPSAGGNPGITLFGHF
jgi:hypothetical protein